MLDAAFADMFPLSRDETPYRHLSGDGVSVEIFRDSEIVMVAPSAITKLTAEAFRDVSHLLRPGHLKQLRSILDDTEASPNDRFVALELMKNANIAAAGILPMCQDTGTAIVMGKKGQKIWVDGNDALAISEGVAEAYTKLNLRYSQLSPSSLFEEKNTGNNLPAQLDLLAVPGDAYKFMFMAKGGGSANKSFLFQKTKAVLNPTGMKKFIEEEVRALGTSACPPYHLAIVVGGTSAELTMKTVKLASARYLDSLPTKGGVHGQAFRDLEMEQEVLEMTRTIRGQVLLP
jgi:fumarate hydratase class I